MPEQNNVLMIMHPREVVEVIESINKIDMPKAWFRAYNSLEIGAAMNKFVSETNYDNYIITSDDLILYPDATKIVNEIPMMTEEELENVRENNIPQDSTGKYPVVSGYCNMCLDSEYVGLCHTPLTLTNGCYPLQKDYNLMLQTEVEEMEDDIFETYFIGFSLTKIPRHIWMKFPFAKYVIFSGVNQTGILKGVSSDHNISYRLTQAGIKMYSHKHTFCKHLKLSNTRSRHGATLKKNMLIGKEPPHVIWEK